MTTCKMMLAALTIGFLTMSNPVQAVEPNATQTRSQNDVVNSAARLTKLAYVSSRSHTKTEYVNGTVYKDGSYDLTYKFYYKDSDNDPQTFTLRFEYAENGRLNDVKTVSHSSFWEPFNALKLAGAFLDGVAKELNRK